MPLGMLDGKSVGIPDGRSVGMPDGRSVRGHARGDVDAGCLQALVDLLEVDPGRAGLARGRRGWRRGRGGGLVVVPGSLLEHAVSIRAEASSAVEVGIDAERWQRHGSPFQG